jgi:oxalate decarboxylase/phosphoglucose isomerase-like protein (cupin superfamily)
MSSIHAFNLEAIKPQAVRNGGSRAMANENNFSILKGMALYSLLLDSGGVREPHWHPNAAELSYCLSGKALMTIFSPGAGHDTFTVDRVRLYLFLKAIFITSRISITERLNLQLPLITRSLKILEYLVQLVQ